MDGQPVDSPVPDLWVSISELARIKGCSKQAISKRVKRLVNSQMLTVQQYGSEVKVNIVAFNRAIKDTTDPAQALRNASLPPAAESLLDAANNKSTKPASGYLFHKETSAAYQAENDRLDLEERLGRTCDRADVEARTFTVFRRLRDRLLSLPAVLAPRVVNALDERAARVIVDEEVRKMLNALAKDLDRADDDGAGDEFDQEPAGAAQHQ